MCKTHPAYKAIRKPKKLKATGVVCPECAEIYTEKHFDTLHEPTNYIVDHDYDPSKF